MNILQITTFVILASIFPAREFAASELKHNPSEGNREIGAKLLPILQKHNLPAMGGAIVRDSGEISIGVVGVRRAGGDDAVSLQDLWHIGSCAKAMHATLTAKLVERGKLTWDTKLKTVFPDLAGSFKGEFGELTLLHLLSHRAGLPRNSEYSRLSRFHSVQEQRLGALQEAGSLELSHKPGTRYLYSNLGYIVAGAVVERVMGRSYEDLMRKELFLTMGMSSAVFESSDLPGRKKHPWSHDRKGRPVKESSFLQNDPPVLRPAGCVRCTLQDWGKFIHHHLRGERGTSNFLDRETYRRLHTPPFGGDYALGWVVAKRDWGGGAVLHHTGSNVLNYSNVWIAPEKGFAVLVCTNQDCFEATDEAASALIELHAKWSASPSPSNTPLQRQREF